MNLIHLQQKKDKNLVLGADVRNIRRPVHEKIYNGFELAVGPDSGIRLKTALRWYPLCTRVDTAGWLAIVDAPDWNVFRDDPARFVLLVAFVNEAGETVAETRVHVGPTPCPVYLPSLPDPITQAESEALDLVVTNVSPAGQRIGLLLSETVPTEAFYAQARGTGVEIGPGPYPRILPGPDCEVFYVERETAEEFKKKYNVTGKFESLDSPEAQAYWKQIIVGRANDLPFDDGSLDFIFSADVVEHLVNPLGHLEYWRRKIKPGGRVLAILPHISGCSDYINRPTKFPYWEDQYRLGGFTETVAHHAAFAQPRNLSPESLFAKGYSSHFSFFNAENLAEMMNFAVNEIGYKGFNIYYGRNSKKMHFALFN